MVGTPKDIGTTANPPAQSLKAHLGGDWMEGFFFTGVWMDGILFTAFFWQVFLVGNEGPSTLNTLANLG